MNRKAIGQKSRSMKASDFARISAPCAVPKAERSHVGVVANHACCRHVEFSSRDYGSPIKRFAFRSIVSLVYHICNSYFFGGAGLSVNGSRAEKSTEMNNFPLAGRKGGGHLMTLGRWIQTEESPNGPPDRKSTYKFLQTLSGGPAYSKASLEGKGSCSKQTRQSLFLDSLGHDPIATQRSHHAQPAIQLHTVAPAPSPFRVANTAF